MVLRQLFILTLLLTQLSFAQASSCKDTFKTRLLNSKTALFSNLQKSSEATNRYFVELKTDIKQIPSATKIKLANYKAEVKENKSRLFIKPDEAFTDENTERSLIGKSLVAPFRLMGKLYDLTVNRPFAYVSSKIHKSGKAYIPAFFLSFPLMTYSGIELSNALDNFYDYKKQEIQQDFIQENQSIIADYIENDYRFSEIRDLLQSNKIDKASAELMVFQFLQTYADYLKLSDLNFEKMSLENQQEVLKNALFNDIVSILQNGISEQNNLRLNPNRPQIPNDKEKLQLIKLHHQLILNFEVAAYIVQPDPIMQKALKNFEAHIENHQLNNYYFFLEFYKSLNRIQNDPYFKALKHAYEQQKISYGDFKYLLQEDQYYHIYFQMLKTLGVTRLKVKNSEVSSEALNQQDIRNEILSKIK